MKIKMNAGDFASAVGYAAKFAAKNAVQQTLQYVLVDADAGRIAFTGGDGETFAVASEDADEIGEPGRALLPARLLAMIASRLPDGTVSVDKSGLDTEIRCGGARFKVRGLDPAEYPQTDPVADGTRVTLKSDLFAEFVDQVARAAGTDESRPMLTGVLVDVDGDRLVGVATDSYRLAVRRIERSPSGAVVDGDLDKPLVPARAIEEAARSAGGTETVELVFGPSHVRVESGSRVIVTRLIEQDFPAWQRLLPDADAADASIEVDRLALIDALNRVSVVAAGMSNVPLRIVADSDAKTLTLAASSEQLGEADETLGVDVEGASVEMSFNPDYLRSGLEAIGSSKVRFAAPAGLKPVLLLPAADGDGAVDDYTFLLMPMRTS